MSSEKIVITFRSRLHPGFDSELVALGTRMYELAAAMPGFLSYKDYGAADGENVAIVEFDTMEHLAGWRNHPEHLAAQQVARSRYFTWYQIQVCKLIREYSFEGSD